MLLFFRNILQLLLSPAKGWEDISADGADPHWLLRRCLVPLMVAAALSVCLQRIYDDTLTVAVMVEQALVVFAALFVTYFFAVTMYSSFLYRFCQTEPGHKRYATAAVYSTALVSLSLILCNAMPVDMGLSFLLPLCIAMVLWKADTYLGVNREHAFYAAVFGFGVAVLPPYLLIAFFNLLIV